MPCMECGGTDGHDANYCMLKNNRQFIPPTGIDYYRPLPTPSRNYKCGVCFGEFDNGNNLTGQQIDDGRKFCPFCDINSRRKKK